MRVSTGLFIRVPDRARWVMPLKEKWEQGCTGSQDEQPGHFCQNKTYLLALQLWCCLQRVFARGGDSEAEPCHNQVVGANLQEPFPPFQICLFRLVWLKGLMAWIFRGQGTGLIWEVLAFFWTQLHHMFLCISKQGE